MGKNLEEFVDNWIEQRLTVDLSSFGLDFRQIMQQITLDYRSHLDEHFLADEMRSIIKQNFANDSVRAYSTTCGFYQWWGVKPVGWIPGWRDLSTEFLSRLDSSDFHQSAITWEHAESFGEALHSLLWKFRSIGIKGVLGHDHGQLIESLHTPRPGKSSDSDFWKWMPDDEYNRDASGKVGVSIYEIRPDTLARRLVNS